MARGIYVRETDLDPLINLMYVAEPRTVAEREARTTFLNQLRDTVAATPESEIESDRVLRYEYADNILAYTEARTQLRLRGT